MDTQAERGPLSVPDDTRVRESHQPSYRRDLTSLLASSSRSSLWRSLSLPTSFPPEVPRLLSHHVVPSLTVASELKFLKRTLFMIAMPVSVRANELTPAREFTYATQLAVVISTIYWTLLAFVPQLILRPDPAFTVPTSSSTVPPLIRIPLKMDLAMHAAPAISLLIDFVFFERKYGKREALYGATAVAAMAGLWYACWVEYCAQQNGVCTYAPSLRSASILMRSCTSSVPFLDPQPFRDSRGYLFRGFWSRSRVILVAECPPPLTEPSVVRRIHQF